MVLVTVASKAGHFFSMEVKLAIGFTDFFLLGPGGLRAPPVVADGSGPGHCFH